MKLNTKRVAFFDILRGFMLINMVIYHLLYDLVYIEGYSIPWYHSMGAQLWQETIACTFILVSGACSHYSKNNFKRGIIIFCWAELVTLITSFLGPDFIVMFGILHCLGICMMLFPIISPITQKISGRWGLLGCVFIYFATAPLQDYSFPINLFPLGIHTRTFMSSDYFPLLPYFFVFLAGSFIAKLKMPEWMLRCHVPILEKIGQHSLWIYLLHQPILYLLIPAFRQ